MSGSMAHFNQKPTGSFIGVTGGEGSEQRLKNDAALNTRAQVPSNTKEQILASITSTEQDLERVKSVDNTLEISNDNLSDKQSQREGSSKEKSKTVEEESKKDNNGKLAENTTECMETHESNTQLENQNTFQTNVEFSDEKKKEGLLLSGDGKPQVDQDVNKDVTLDEEIDLANNDYERGLRSTSESQNTIQRHSEVTDLSHDQDSTEKDDASVVESLKSKKKGRDEVDEVLDEEEGDPVHPVVSAQNGNGTR